MKHPLLALLLMLSAIAFGITGAIWVGIHLGGWGLAVIAGVALGIMGALPWLGLATRRMSGPSPYGASWGQGAYPGWTPDGPGIEGYAPGSGYGLPMGIPGRERPGAPPGLPFLGMPWVSWVAWVPGFHPTPSDIRPGGWSMLPPATPRTFTVIGDEEE